MTCKAFKTSYPQGFQLQINAPNYLITISMYRQFRFCAGKMAGCWGRYINLGCVQFCWGGSL
jgi:hypothetical protein